MMKVVSFFIFVAAFVWTWSLLTSKNALSTDVHAGIQSKLMILIEETVKAKRPNSTNFILHTIYTEKIDDNKVRARFTYEFSDSMEDKEQTSQRVQGEAILGRSLSENEQVQKWIIQSVKTSASNLEFKEGLVISSDNDEVQDATSTSGEKPTQ